jgi:hypothetical protein
VTFDDRTLDGYHSRQVGLVPAVHTEKSKVAKQRRIVSIVKQWLELGPAEEVLLLPSIAS